MRRNPDLLTVVACLLNNVLEHFRICESGFIRICDAKKSGQFVPGNPNLSGCEFQKFPDAVYKKKQNKSKKEHEKKERTRKARKKVTGELI